MASNEARPCVVLLKLGLVRGQEKQDVQANPVRTKIEEEEHGKD